MHNGPTLEVDVSAITRNYALLRKRLGGTRCAAVVKANAYGLGAAEIAPKLYDAGCRDFFVATLEEGIALRAEFDEDIEPRILLADARIYVFHGVRAGEVREFTAHSLIPVLNDMGQIEHWNNAGPCALHIDTGMRRLGLTLEEAKKLPNTSHRLELVMSHLACAGEPENPMNGQQLGDFQAALSHFPGIAASLANSSGIFLSPDYHYSLARPGCSLYGISPNTSLANPMENVATLSAPVLQYRTIRSPQSVGYGATATVPAGTVLATVELGYADGLSRSLSNKLHGFVGNIRVPLVGRVSMDMVSIDVSQIPEHLRTPELRIGFIGKEQPVDAIAREAGTIGYEIFTRLGARIKRIYP